MKFKYRYSLEKHRNGKPKHICPKCGKRSFVRYIDNLTNQYVADHVGKCDRLENCNHHLHPYDYLKSISANGYCNTVQKNYQVRSSKSITSQINIVDCIPFDYANKTRLQKENSLNDYLYRIFGESRVNEVNWNYYVGSAKNRMVIFPLIDINGVLRSGKFMAYNPETGRRLRDTTTYVFDWLHSILIRKKLLPENFALKTCFFGEHLIGLDENRDKIICIVESEKTAIIASLCISDCLFIATGSLENLTIERLKPLIGRKIKLYPDTSENGSAFEKWKKKADEARLLGFDISVSDFLEKNCTEEQKQESWDLGDYLIDRVLKSREAIKQQVTDEPKQLNATDNQSDSLKKMIKLNPTLQILIDEFDAVEV
ncbi:hypothetical protein JGH11_17290 [Dysgonomonas sp. Marseille-P4677]|uniref:DUF6371 domain-containing protein n=1 Tax=Dysgonomonas sp. Marseille-P4677 TaxID=2364790 RepID=UPI001912B53D|nr:DUF6371 domain-containing protein [Dysgonomonas sp. Marseille-P4677]MBK5722632.1 hypothetical protein [Dysgonomonas sp. Marseille-P4677]